MSAVNSPGGSAGKSIAAVVAVVLAVVGVLFLILGVVYLVVPAHSLPGFVGYIKNGGTGKHDLRMAASFVVGVVCLGAAWYVRKGRRPAPGDSASTPMQAGYRE